MHNETDVLQDTWELQFTWREVMDENAARVIANKEQL